MNKDRDMTVGNSFKLIGVFALSLILGNLFQQLYIFIDTIIIGNKIGSLGLAAAGGTEWLLFLVNGFVIGLIQGFSVLLGNKFGEKDEEAFETYYQKAKKICVILSIVLVIICLAFSGIILQLIGTKEEVLPYAKTYVNTIFLGLPFLIFYQLFAATLRSRGNSATPLMALTISSICNIGLDLILMYGLQLGIMGAALGTIISEAIVMLVCGYYVYKIRSGQHQKSNSKENEIAIVSQLLKMGIPMATQSVITAVGGLIVVNRINQYDISFLNGYTAAGKLYGLLEIAASSFGLAVASYVSQNFGAGNITRIRKGVRVSLLMGVLCSVVCSLIMFFGGKSILLMFLPKEEVTSEMIGYGYRYLTILAVFYSLLFVLYIVRSSLQGINNSIIPMISSFGQLIMRLSCAVILTRLIGCEGIFWGEIMAWVMADSILIVAYFIQMRHREVGSFFDARKKEN